jgi:hypothetical protein
MTTRTVNNKLDTQGTPFWPGGQRSLQLQYPAGSNSAEQVTVVCVDPANKNEAVFKTTIRRGQLDALAAAMENGTYTVSNDNKSTDTVILSEPGPRAFRITLPVTGG